MITPNEIENKQFIKKGRGYSAEDVDDFMDHLAVDYERLYIAVREQSEQIDTLNKAVAYYQSIENTLNNALVLAEKTVEERKNAAEVRAAQIEKEAVLRGEAVLQDAKNRIFGLQQDISRLENQFDRMRSRVCILLEAELDLLERFDIAEDMGSIQQEVS